VIRILKDLKQKYPEKELDQLVELANYYALLHQQKSRAFYRVQATRMMIGAGNVLKKHAADHARRAVVVGGDEASEEDDLAVCSRISFESAHSQCMENCGTITIPVVALSMSTTVRKMAQPMLDQIMSTAKARWCSNREKPGKTL
ncbi:hypothetical protein M9458_031067, partial [Cirrhinus mrigala]